MSDFDCRDAARCDRDEPRRRQHNLDRGACVIAPPLRGAKNPAAHSIWPRAMDRKQFEGTELYNKTLGIIGMGRIGSELSRRAIAFGMRVLAYDPYLSSTRARSLQVELVEEIDELLPLADFLTLHTPLTPETHHLLNAARLTKTKRGVRRQLRARRLHVGRWLRVATGKLPGRARCFRTSLSSQSRCAGSNYPYSPLGPRRRAQKLWDRIASDPRPSRGNDPQRRQMPNLVGRHSRLSSASRFGEKLGRFLSQVSPSGSKFSHQLQRKVRVDTTAITRSILKGSSTSPGVTLTKSKPAFAET